MGLQEHAFKNFSVHMYTAPEDGCRVNSFLVETEGHLMVIDTQWLLPYADEVWHAAQSLKKPIARVIITHAHPDHWFGTSRFDGLDIYALPSVQREMAMDAVTAFERNKPHLGDKIGDHAVLPNRALEADGFTVDGVRFLVHEVRGTEAPTLTLLEIPEEKLLLASDLAYGRTHIYVAGGQLKPWREELARFAAMGFRIVLPGHGVSASPDALRETADYLRTAERVISASGSFPAFRKEMLRLYPERDGVSLLDLNEMFLSFPARD